MMKVSGLSMNTMRYCSGSASTGTIAEDRKSSAVASTPVTWPMSRRNTLSADSSQPTPSAARASGSRSEEHTSELQSRENLVCRLLLEKKKKKKTNGDILL